MASIEQELLASLNATFDRDLPNQILAVDVKSDLIGTIDAMVQVEKHRNALSLYPHNPTRSLSYQKDEIVFYMDRFYKSKIDNNNGTFFHTNWEEINLLSHDDNSFTREVTDVDFTVGEMAYHDGTGYKKAIADSEAFENDTYALFIVQRVNDDLVTFGTSGSILEIDLGFTGTHIVYLSNLVAGGVLTQKPLNLPYQQVGFYADGIFHFNPTPIAIEEVEEEDTTPTSEIINKSADFNTNPGSVNAYYRYDNANPGTCTIEAGTVPVGETVFFRQVGDGVLTFVAGAGVTLIANISGELVSIGKGDTVSFVAVATDTYEMI